MNLKINRNYSENTPEFYHSLCILMPQVCHLFEIHCNNYVPVINELLVILLCELNESSINKIISSFIIIKSFPVIFTINTNLTPVWF